MTHEPDRGYWQQYGQPDRDGGGSMADRTPNPYLARELVGLTPGTALDAGCGAGAEAIWLAAHGWRVTAVDIAAGALARAAERATAADVAVDWVEADLTTWQPGSTFDLVTTHDAHPAMPQPDFYRRVADWVAPGGTLLVVGRRHTHDRVEDRRHRLRPPDEATATAAGISALLDDGWRVVTAEERRRSTPGHGSGLYDVVVRATRLR